jgi:hypothetical protein
MPKLNLPFHLLIPNPMLQAALEQVTIYLKAENKFIVVSEEWERSIEGKWDSMPLERRN